MIGTIANPRPTKPWLSHTIGTGGGVSLGAPWGGPRTQVPVSRLSSVCMVPGNVLQRKSLKESGKVFPSAHCTNVDVVTCPSRIKVMIAHVSQFLRCRLMLVILVTTPDSGYYNFISLPLSPLMMGRQSGSDVGVTVGKVSQFQLPGTTRLNCTIVILVIKYF